MDKGFRHEALFYTTREELLAATTSFVRHGLAAGEPTLVALDQAKIAQLRTALGSDADRVSFTDMTDTGRNPARLMAAWHRFITRHGGEGRTIRGVGEPIWAGRSPAELVECRHHEALLNIAFAENDVSLLCPYDISSLDPTILAEAHGTHPYVCRDGDHQHSAGYSGIDTAGLLREPLPLPPWQHHEMSFRSVRAVRRFLKGYLAAACAESERTSDVILAVNEIAANSLRHGGGAGKLTMWSDRDTLTCQIQDRGWITDPLAGRRDPEITQRSGRGLWMANQLCDITQVRTSPHGSTVRLHFTSLLPC